MRLLITAGGTSEKIDEVRSITNHSSGRLGKTIAETCTEAHIDYVTTPQALHPTGKNIRLHVIRSTAELAEIMQKLLTEHTYTAVIHSMAVSDFTPESAVTIEELEAVLAEQPTDLAKALEARSSQRTAKKISSATEHLVLVLKKNPKIVQLIKQLQPETTLISFKLLVDVPQLELLTVAKESLEKNHADFVFANDLTQISGEHHHGYLIDAHGKVKEAQTKTEIAELIKHTLEENL